MTSPPPPPEAELIAAKRTAQIPHLSMREAARRARISPTRWRQLETGRMRIKGQEFAEIAPAETLARMAQTVGATPTELTEAGRADAAAILEQLPADPMAQLVIDLQNASGLTGRQKRALLELLGRHQGGNTSGEA